ncbi:MAG: tetratricopeptide repeat protein [Bacteroidota bacterium]
MQGHQSPYWAVIFFILSLVPPLAAQDTVLDSLEQLAAQSTDSARIDALLAWGTKLRQVDLEQSANVFKMARDEAAELGYLRRQLRAGNKLGVSYGMMGNYGQALEQFTIGLDLHTASGNLLGMAESYNNIGIVYQHTGDYPSSIETYLSALPLYDSLDDKSGTASCLHNIGVVNDMMGEDENALEYFKKALLLKKEASTELDYSLTLHSIALVYDRQARYDEALQLLFEHLEILRKYQDGAREANTLNTIGKLYISLGSMEAAENYLLDSREKCIELGVKSPLSHVYYNLAKVHLDRNNPALAIDFLNQSILIGSGLKSAVLQKQAHDLMVEAYSKEGNYQQALKHLEIANSFRDSLFSAEKNSAFQQWQSRLNVYEKNQQLEAQQRELRWLDERLLLDRRLRLALIAALFVVMVAALLFFQKNKLRKRANQELAQKNQHIESQRKEIASINDVLEKRMLRAQMNPHFIFNSLSSIQHFITANDKKSALRYLSKFSSLLRQVLEDSITNTTVLSEEVQLLKTYLELESLRFDKGFEYHIHISPELDPHTTEIPILLVQPYVENAILHGLMPKKGPRQLNVYFEKEMSQLVCRIVDNGIGRKAAAALKAQKKGSHTSRGMQVAQKRLEALNRQQEEQTLLVINDLYDDHQAPQGTEVIIKIPES